MGSTTSVEKQPPEEPPPLDVPTEPEHQEATAAGLWPAAVASWCSGSVGTSSGGGSSGGLSIDIIEPIIRYELASGAGGCPTFAAPMRRLPNFFFRSIAGDESFACTGRGAPALKMLPKSIDKNRVRPVALAPRSWSSPCARPVVDPPAVDSTLRQRAAPPPNPGPAHRLGLP